MPERTGATELRILGRALSHLRNARGLTQKELGKRIAMDHTYISRIERTFGVGWLTLRRLLQTLDTSLHRLADAIEHEERNEAAS